MDVLDMRAIASDAENAAYQIDSLYEEAMNYPCTCRTDEHGCPYCGAIGVVRAKATEVIRSLVLLYKN